MDKYKEAAKLITKARDYKREYKNYHGKPEQVKARASRNAARRKLAKQGRVKPGDGKDVDHRDHDPMNNDDKNLRARDMSHNRADNKRKAYVEAANLMTQIQRAGARHSSRDNSLIQQLHDLACELGAECRMKESGMVHPQLKAAVEALVQRHGSHDQKAHGRRHGVGGLREFAKSRGYQVRQVKDKSGKTQLAITNKRGDKMRAGGLTEARKLITGANKFRRESARKLQERRDFGVSIGDVVKPKDKTGLGVNNAFQSRIVGRKGANFVVKPVSVKPGSFADREFLIPKKEAIKV